MFSGDERASITTELSEEDFDTKAQEALETLGNVDITSGGSFTISPKTTLVSFLSTANITGKIKQTDGGYQINVEYVLAPSPACWIIAVVAFCFTFVGAAVIVAPLVIDKPNVAKAIENALRDLKDTLSPKKRRSKNEED